MFKFFIENELVSPNQNKEFTNHLTKGLKLEVRCIEGV